MFYIALNSYWIVQTNNLFMVLYFRFFPLKVHWHLCYVDLRDEHFVATNHIQERM